jgi:general stress protein 26
MGARTGNPKALILRILNEHRIMTVATNRADGWPQATIVGYVNDGFLLYSFIARNSQKCANILRDSRVSVAIGRDTLQPLDIRGLSLAGGASLVDDQHEFDYVSGLRLQRYPEYAGLPAPVFRGGALQRISPRPSSDGVVLLRIAPEIISLIDYSRGFGHSDLITFSELGLDVHLDSARHRWDDDRLPDPVADSS